MLIHQFAEMVEEVLTGEVKDSMLASFRLASKAAVVFDFQDVTAIPDEEWSSLQGFTIDLMRNGVFQAPYRNCVLSYQADDSDRIIIISDGKLIQGMFDGVGDYEVLYGERLRMSKTPIVIASAVVFLGDVPEHSAANLPNEPRNGLPVIGMRKIHYAHGNIGPAEIEDANLPIWKQLLNQIFQNCAALFGLLNSRGVTLLDEPAPERLNKARARKGLHPIVASKKVVIRVGDRRVSVSGETGGHASPRMHWRRGHVRRLESGKIVKVRPHLVGNIGQAAKPDYSVVRVLP